MTKKSIFLTGGNGFIGRNLIEQLSGKYDIHAPKRGDLDLLDAEAVEKFIRKNNFDVIIHAANIGGNRKDPGPPNMAELNMRMFFNIARCSKYFGKMIYFGSGAEYGKQRDLRRVKEDEFDNVVPSDSYGFYKYVCAKCVEKSENIVCLRIFGCYGKYEDYEYKFISNAICRSLFQMPIMIKNQNVLFSYLYIGDLIRIIIYFIDNKCNNKFYNIVPNETIELLTISNIIKEASEGKTEIVVKNPGMGKEYTGDNALLKKELKGFKFTDSKTGIIKLREWYKENIDTIEKNRL